MVVGVQVCLVCANWTDFILFRELRCTPQAFPPPPLTWGGRVPPHTAHRHHSHCTRHVASLHVVPQRRRSVPSVYNMRGRPWRHLLGGLDVQVMAPPSARCMMLVVYCGYASINSFPVDPVSVEFFFLMHTMHHCGSWISCPIIRYHFCSLTLSSAFLIPRVTRFIQFSW